MVLGRVKRCVLAMLARRRPPAAPSPTPYSALRVAPLPPREERDAFDPPCAALAASWRRDGKRPDVLTAPPVRRTRSSGIRFGHA